MRRLEFRITKDYESRRFGALQDAGSAPWSRRPRTESVGRGLYVAGAAWDEGNMVHAMRRFGGGTIGWRFGDGQT